MNKTVVFDMDGVLFDTERLCVEVWEQVARERGIQDIKNVAMGCIGLNNNDAGRFVRSVYGEDFPYHDFKARVSEVFFDRIAKEGLPVKSGVQELLSFLKEEKYQVGLASSTGYESVVSHLKQAALLDYFQVIVTGNMVEHSKPQPDIYLLACEKLKAEPGECFAIEDSYNGIRSAWAAGMKAVMVPDLLAPDEEMRRLSFLICRDLWEVQRYLAEQE